MSDIEIIGAKQNNLKNIYLWWTYNRTSWRRFTYSHWML